LVAGSPEKKKVKREVKRDVISRELARSRESSGRKKTMTYFGKKKKEGGRRTVGDVRV